MSRVGGFSFNVTLNTSTGTIRLIRDGETRARPPRLSHSSWAPEFEAHTATLYYTFRLCHLCPNLRAVFCLWFDGLCLLWCGSENMLLNIMFVRPERTQFGGRDVVFAATNKYILFSLFLFFVCLFVCFLFNFLVSCCFGVTCSHILLSS